MHFTLAAPGAPPRDYWAEDGATLRQTLADLELAGGAWNRPLDQPVPAGAWVEPAERPGEGDADLGISAGGWRLVALGGPRAGAGISLRAPASP
ncbi:MAG: hypothetical protein LBD90_04030, partial [Bifidobacteriaceae bacterium]|nr:hypothetical protein [Bifidobacteriaceae bacterium]